MELFNLLVVASENAALTIQVYDLFVMYFVVVVKSNLSGISQSNPLHCSYYPGYPYCLDSFVSNTNSRLTYQ